MAASPLVLVSDGGPFTNPTPIVGEYPGTIGFDADAVPGPTTISIMLQDTTDVATWKLQTVGVDELSVYPTLSSVNPATHVVLTPSTIVTFSLPAVLGSAFGFKSTVVSGSGTSEVNFGIYTLTAIGGRVGFVGELREGNITFGWATKVNPLIRAAAADNFSWKTIPAGATVTIPNYQQMLVSGGIDIIGTLDLIGELVLLEI